MARTEANGAALKQAIKAAFRETLQEERDLLHDIFLEVLEDVALAEAIREGQKTKRSSRKEVFEILRGRS